MFHRFFSRASWCLDSVSGALFRLADQWIPSDEPLYLPLDDTLARKGGKCIALASIHHDPLLSTRRKPFFSYGHCWVVLSVWVPLPMGGFALPIFFRLFVGRKRGGEGNAPSRRASRKRLRTARRAFKKNKYRTKLQLAREMIAELAALAPRRTIYVICDSAYAGRMILEKRPPNVHVISRLRMDAALYAPPPPVTPGVKGRPRRRGKRLPKPARSAACCKKWVTCRINIYSSEVETWITTRTALWYVALRDAPVKIVIVRDPNGHRKDEAFFSTDTSMEATVILETFAKRWSLEVTFHDAKQLLGFEDPQNQTAKAVRRTAPMAFVVYDLVLLWYAQRIIAGNEIPWLVRPWYRRKERPSFADMLAAVRRASWRLYVSDPSRITRRRKKSVAPWIEAVISTA